MNFGYSNVQLEIRELARRIFSDHVSHESLTALERSTPQQHDGAVWQHLASTGLLGVAGPADDGGLGLGFIELCILFEEAGRALARVPLLPSTLAALTLQRFPAEPSGDDVEQLASGDRIATLALAESAQFDYRVLHTRAHRDNGRWLLDGEKTCVPYLPCADRVLVSANTADGPGLFLVDPTAAGAHIEPVRTTAGEPGADLRLEATPGLPLPGGAEALDFLAQRLMAALCCFQLGCSETALRMTADYVAQREQFGVKIGTFQAVGHRAANGYIDVSCLRLVTLQAASLLAQERDATTAVTIAKCWAGDVSHRVSYACQHLHGGLGADRDYALWRYATYSKACEITLGCTGYLLSQLGRGIAGGHFTCE